MRMTSSSSPTRLIPNLMAHTPKEAITHLPISNRPYPLSTLPHPNSQAPTILNSSNPSYPTSSPIRIKSSTLITKRIQGMGWGWRWRMIRMIHWVWGRFRLLRNRLRCSRLWRVWRMSGFIVRASTRVRSLQLHLLLRPHPYQPHRDRNPNRKYHPPYPLLAPPTPLPRPPTNAVPYT